MTSRKEVFKELEQSGMNRNSLRVLKGSQELKRNNPTDAGLDIKSAETVLLKARSKEIISTGVRLKLPDGTVGIVKSRSGLSAKNSIEVGAGVIDEEYIGEIKVILYNHSNIDFQVNTGDRIAQLVIFPIFQGNPVIVDSLDDTIRGDKGFGNSGIK